MSKTNTHDKKPQSLQLSRLNYDLKDFSKEILELGKTSKKGKLYKKFLEVFFSYIPVDYILEDKLSFFKDITNEAFDFFKQKSTHRKVEIIQTKFENNNAITILILTKNKPFLIDSLKSLITKLGFEVLFGFHSIIHSTRVKDGNILDIVKSKTDDSISESLVCFKILGDFSSKTLQSINDDINKTIDLVESTYNSWQSLTDKIVEITTNTIKHKKIYAENKLAIDETLDFLNWIQMHNFTFFGVIDFIFENNFISITSEIGVNEIWKDNIEELHGIIGLSSSELYQRRSIILGKLNKLSPIHRNVLIDYILVKQYDDKGNYVKGKLILGLYGLGMYYESIKDIPLLRDKMNYILRESGFVNNGYNAKKLKNIIESLPRDLVVQIDHNDLFNMTLHMLSTMISHKLKIFVQNDWSESFLNILIFMSREKLTSTAYKNIIQYLTKTFNGKILNNNTNVISENFVHLFLTIKVESKQINFKQEDLEKALLDITTNWSDELYQILCTENDHYKAKLKHKSVENLFPEDYRNKFTPNCALKDLEYLKKIYKGNEIEFNLLMTNSEEKLFELKIYSSKQMSLSDILPDVENIGFRALDELTFKLNISDIDSTNIFDCNITNTSNQDNIKNIWIYVFHITSPLKINENDFNIIKNNVEKTLHKINNKSFSSDKMSALLVYGMFDWRYIKLFKALVKYIHQTKFPYDMEYVHNVVLKHHELIILMKQFFDLKFDPQNHKEYIKKHSVTSINNLNTELGYVAESTEKIDEQINKYLDGVISSSDDRILRDLYMTIKAILRTNFYQIDKKTNEYKDVISFKLRSKLVPNLPLPLPYAEIFVYANEFEGIHLRGDKVARGGIRWSDRGEDYRMEVLGLMKSQVTKNTIIVPTGSKGVFYIKSHNTSQDADFMKHAISCYKNFLRGLLDITDNIVKNKLHTPENTVFYDNYNPYLVVAADKGTAAFSDFANEVSAEYKFWLRDAFASGGSVGYDHKKMGITTKGAWISVQLHFANMGIDVQKDPITVVGIGDMSGDVFGNGMLMSKTINLVAAFNHKHIFIDPNPDSAKSYKERKRLFDKPRSQWSDYNTDIISEGGGIFERSSKVINLSDTAKSCFKLNKNKFTPDELIKAILQSNIDLIWNGGIGTYIKASHESHPDIADKCNDNLRCNGKDIKAKVIGEGGNLGASQLGRIEYSLSGGKINSDFIDNSAGVNCSDQEVNIKIALNGAVDSGKITLKKRNELLEKMTEEVEELVLLNNYKQNQAITITELSDYFVMSNFNYLIKELSNNDLLNPKVEFLPDEQEMEKRILQKQSITRPELSILLAYSKMAVNNELSQSKMLKDSFFEKYLLEYFPTTMRKDFKQEIITHPLRDEIICTIITNKIVNQLGGVVINSIKRNIGAPLCDIVRAYIIICEIFEIDTLWNQIDEIDNKSLNINDKVKLYVNIGRSIRQGISWIIKNSNHPIKISENIDLYKNKINSIIHDMSEFVTDTSKKRYVSKMNRYMDYGIKNELSQKLALLHLLVSSFDIINISQITKQDNKIVGKIYFAIADKFSIDWLRNLCEAQNDHSYWKRLSLQSLKDDLYDKQRRITINILKKSKSKEHQSIDLLLSKYNDRAAIFMDFVKDIKLQKDINLDMIVLANKKLELFLRKLQ